MAASSSAANLRRRLERDGGVLGGSGNIDESFVVIGTPLPALSSTKRDNNELKPVWEQEVRDEQGRQRFHGAFTGGFSAGYYNTVGSKEGWTPSSFKSSRKSRAGPQQQQQQSRQGDARGAGAGAGAAGQRIEDFMDEEDLADLRDARELQGTDSFAGPSSSIPSGAALPSAPSGNSAEYDPILGAFGLGPSTALSSGVGADGRIRPAPESLGTALLRKLGWKEGHGIGPRVTRKRRDELRTLLAPRTAGAGSGSGAVDGSRGKDDGDEAIPSSSRALLYPPPDTPLMRPPTASVDGRGLGWSAPVGLHDAVGQDTSQSFVTAGIANAKNKQRQRGFGISVLEHDSDDEGEMGGNAVYATTDDIQASTLSERKGGHKSGRHSSPEARRSNGKERAHAPKSGDDDEKENTWRDARPMPTGFVRAKTKDGGFLAEQIFPAPELPKDWKPDPAAVWARYAPPIVPDASSGKPRHALGPQDRGELLGELRIPGPPPVISDYLSVKARERLSAAAGSGDAPLPIDGARATHIPLPTERTLEVPKLDSAIARAALQGYMPFANDFPKQERYKLYLRSQAEPRTGSAEQLASALEEELKATVQNSNSGGSSSSRWDSRAPPTALGHDQLRLELQEFFRSAGIFRPSTAIITSRFTSAKEQSQAGGGAAVQGGLYVPSAADRAASAAAAKALSEGGPGASTSVTDVMAHKGDVLVAGDEDPAIAAAAMGMFGVLTRRYKEWYPSKLLCKRFGVPDPHPDYNGPRFGERERNSGGAQGGPPPGGEDGEDRFATGSAKGGGKRSVHDPKQVNALWEQSKRGIMQLARDRGWEAHGSDSMNGGDQSADLSTSAAGPSKSGGKGKPRSLETVGLGDDDTQGQDTLAYVRPPIEVFKAVFDSDDDGEGGDDEVGLESVAKGGVKTEHGAAGDQHEAERELKRRRILNTEAVGDLSEGGVVRFVPRLSLKRKSEDGGGDTSAGDAAANSSVLSSGTKKKAKKDKKKAGGRSGMLTFDLDEGDGADADFSTSRVLPSPSPKKMPPVAPPASQAAATDAASQSGARTAAILGESLETEAKVKAEAQSDEPIALPATSTPPPKPSGSKRARASDYF
ncbi:unnamed protein product [Tilletia controversa]|uniref:G-patch domain-containing protein n=3 Tax=Tilletia TaxID=13289 RepID=A0A8X7MRM4_9BASI|nr:hypothetical protein CF328_g4689 [Tilletia controversa]KAE8196028.1 hypothetical protein CF336_g2808 [Tilletia laevis]KAE8264185.1 hypothetical protein A4X03_0g1124 [Tilletia caries]KAE8205138.1 hypothetical protein CF335_g2405 [Tilletia laevis]KAE8245911.1 hypothetical protein A4X06_0g5332 [Tilletia controversa]